MAVLQSSDHVRLQQLSVLCVKDIIPLKLVGINNTLNQKKVD